jgi:hypothetical protein
MAGTATDETRLGALFVLDVSSYGGLPFCVHDGNGGLTPDKSGYRTMKHLSGFRVISNDAGLFQELFS